MKVAIEMNKLYIKLKFTKKNDELTHRCSSLFFFFEILSASVVKVEKVNFEKRFADAIPYPTKTSNLDRNSFWII